MKRTGIIILLFLPLVFTFATRLTSQQKAAPGKKPDLVAWTGLDQAEGEVFASAFKKHTGGKFSIGVKKVSTGKMAETLEKAGKNCEASIVFGGSLPAYLVAAEKGLFLKYTPPSAEKFDKKFRDPEGRWIGIYVGVIGFAVNSKFAKTPPESWEDLLKPEFKGRISIADPSYSGTSYITLSTLVQLMGEEKAFQYLKKLNAQIQSYPKSGAEPAKMAARGDAAVGISFVHDILRLRKDNPGLSLSFPREGTGLEIGGAAIPLHAPNPELAKKFLDFLASPDAQNIYGTKGVPPRFPTHPGAKQPAATFTKGKSLKIIDFNFAASAADEERLKKRFTKEILSSRKAAE